MKCEIITVRNLCASFAVFFGKKRHRPNKVFVKRQLFSTNVHGFFLGLLLQFISTNKIHLAVLFFSNSRAVFFVCVHFSFEFNWQCHCQLSHIELNQITLLPWKRIRTRMCETHSVYHLTMLTNLVLCRKSFGIVLHVRLTSSKQ